MHIITAKDERAQIMTNGWIIGHNKASGHDYADPNVERSHLFVIGTTESTARAYVSAVLGKGTNVDFITFLGIETVCDWDANTSNGFIIVTPDVGYANDRVQRHVYELIQSIEGNADEDKFTLMLPHTMDMHDFLSGLMEFCAAHGDLQNARLSVHAKDEKDFAKRSDDDHSVFNFRDFINLAHASSKITDFIAKNSDWPEEIFIASDMAALSGEELLRIVSEFSTCAKVKMSFRVWERIYIHLNHDLSRFQRGRSGGVRGKARSK